MIADAGYGEYYVHGLGHGVGLQIHEAPPIGATASGTLPGGATVTVEPGARLYPGTHLEGDTTVAAGATVALFQGAGWPLAAVGLVALVASLLVRLWRRP